MCQWSKLNSTLAKTSYWSTSRDESRSTHLSLHKNTKANEMKDNIQWPPRTRCMFIFYFSLIPRTDKTRILNVFFLNFVCFEARSMARHTTYIRTYICFFFSFHTFVFADTRSFNAKYFDNLSTCFWSIPTSLYDDYCSSIVQFKFDFCSCGRFQSLTKQRNKFCETNRSSIPANSTKIDSATIKPQHSWLI